MTLTVKFKILALATVLITDLLFFLFFAVAYPGIFQMILGSLPWNDDLEKLIIVVLGLLIAIITTVGVIHFTLKAISAPQGGKNCDR